MDLAVLIIAFFVLLFLGIPIAIALCASAILYLVLYTDIPLIIIGQQMLKGVDSFTLMAIPFFVIAGCLMQRRHFPQNRGLRQEAGGLDARRPGSG